MTILQYLKTRIEFTEHERDVSLAELEALPTWQTEEREEVDNSITFLNIKLLHLREEYEIASQFQS